MLDVDIIEAVLFHGDGRDSYEISSAWDRIKKVYMEAVPTAHNNSRDEILPGQCPNCHGCGNVMVSHVNECYQCSGTGKTSPIA